MANGVLRRVIPLVRCGHALSTSSSSSSWLRRYRPRRALLYVPGHEVRKVTKAASLNVDSVCLDCEDGVGVDDKTDARHTISSMLPEVMEQSRSDVAVRLNSVQSGLCTSDLDVLLNGPRLPHTLLLPKVETREELESFFDHINRVGKERGEERIGFGFYVESAMGLMNLPILCSKCFELAFKSKSLMPELVVMGSDDYLADIGALRSSDALELLYARQKVVCVSKAFGLQAIDMVHIDLDDDQGLVTMAEQGMGMGFSGKQVIHPKQIESVQQAFTPSSQRLEWAQQLMDEFAKVGKGAFRFKGQMIDMPTIKQASNLIRIKERIDETSKP